MTVQDGKEELGGDKVVMKPRRAKVGVIQFLQPVIGPEDVERQNRQVKSLTMRRVRQERKGISRSDSQPPRESKDCGELGTALSSGLGSAMAKLSTARKSRYDTLWPGVELGLVDPFQATAMDRSPQNSRLLNHCGF
jgi:hypothetical protein